MGKRRVFVTYNQFQLGQVVMHHSIARRAALRIRSVLESASRDRSIPSDEITRFRRALSESEWYFDPLAVLAAYQSFGLEVAPDAMGAEVARRTVQALEAGEPFSVVRIGDGEANLFRCGRPTETPHLDRFAGSQSIMNQSDRFRITDAWRPKIAPLRKESIGSADVVGGLGLWTAGGPAPPIDEISSMFDRDKRGVVGNWNGRFEMLRLAQAGLLDGKLIASAHLYLGLVRHMRAMLQAAREIYCITDKGTVAARIREIAENKPTTHIPVGSDGDERRLLDTPLFLNRLRSQLPADMEGTLALIGAGPWAELYADDVRRRGGVGIDLGSGFDLMAGTASRSIHRALPEDVLADLLKWARPN